MIRKLNRYTTLPVLLDMLQRQKLTLLDPKLWDDRNDSAVILEFKKRKKIKNLFALCFSHGDETIHHWNTFAHGSSGCVIEFDAQKLLAILDNDPHVHHGKVVYRKLPEVERKAAVIDVDKMPFTKRWPYRVEEEYRIIALTDGADLFYEIDFPLNIIRKITISQHMPEPVYATIKSYLKGIRGEGRISLSTLFQNKRWISRFSKV